MKDNAPQQKSQVTVRRKRRSPSVPATRNRGPWLRNYPEAAADLHDHVLVVHFSGDRKRLSSGDGLFTNRVQNETFAWFIKKYRNIFLWYRKTYGRDLTPHLVMARVRFMYVQYENDGELKRDGTRSREYRDVIR